MLIYILLFLLVISFSTHIASIVFYIIDKSKRSFNTFATTMILNMCLSIAMSIFVLQKPELIRNIDIKFLFWAVSGIVMVILLMVKIYVFRSIFKRRKDPQYYHFNYFGKKVYEDNIIKKSEFFTFIISLPFFLFIGAYFIARLINYFIYGHI